MKDSRPLVARLTELWANDRMTEEECHVLQAVVDHAATDLISFRSSYGSELAEQLMTLLTPNRCNDSEDKRAAYEECGVSDASGARLLIADLRSIASVLAARDLSYCHALGCLDEIKKHLRVSTAPLAPIARPTEPCTNCGRSVAGVGNGVNCLACGGKRSCCANEKRNMRGGCDNCGDPSL